MPEVDNQGRVVYTIPELLQGIQKQLDTIEGMLAAKADSVTVEHLGLRIQRLENPAPTPYGERLVTEFRELQGEVKRFSLLFPVVEKVPGEFEKLDNRVKVIEEGVIGEEAIQKWKTRLIGGSILGAAIILFNFAFNIYRIISHQ